MKAGIIKRIFKAYQTVGSTFGIWIATIFVGLYLLIVRFLNFIFMKIDWIFYPFKLRKKIVKPILIVGNPRSGTTFIHRYLSNNGLPALEVLYPILSYILGDLQTTRLCFPSDVRPIFNSTSISR